MAADPPSLSTNERLKQQRAIRGRVGDKGELAPAVPTAIVVV